MLDDPAEVFAVCLKRDGHSINSSNPSELQASRNLLVAQMWAQVAEAAIESAPQLKFAYPAEGLALYSDVCAILRESMHVALAHEFIKPTAPTRSSLYRYRNSRRNR